MTEQIKGTKNLWRFPENPEWVHFCVQVTSAVAVVRRGWMGKQCPLCCSCTSR